MFRASITVYPWDLIDEGVEGVLDRLRGEVGVTDVSVWAALPAVTQLRTHPVEPRVFRTRGGLLFQADEKRYAATRCKPTAADGSKTGDALNRIAEACTARGLGLRLIVSAGMTGRLASRYTEMTCKNVFGIESHVSVCPVNPDVRAYLYALVSDLSDRFNPNAVILRDFRSAWSDATTENLRLGVPLGETEQTLLSLCFCESCHQKAMAEGVDVGMVRRAVQVMLQKSFDTGVPTDQRFETILSDHQPLLDYFRWRATELTSLLSRLVAACPVDLWLDRAGPESRHQQRDELDYSLPAGVITRLNPEESLESAFAPAAQRNELHLPCSRLLGAQGADLVNMLSQLVRLGFSGVEFDNYALIPASALVSLRQAIRFARRLDQR